VVNSAGCAGGDAGTTLGGAGGVGGRWGYTSKKGGYGTSGQPGSLQTVTSPESAVQCTTLKQASSILDKLNESDTFVSEFLMLNGGQGTDGTASAGSGSGGTGGAGYYVNKHGPDIRGSGQYGGNGGTGAQGADGVAGGGTLAIFAKVIASDAITIQAQGNNGNDGNQGTGESGKEGKLGRKVSSGKGWYNYYGTSQAGTASSSAGTLGSAASQGGIVYLGYGMIPQGFTDNIDVSGGVGGLSGMPASSDIMTGEPRAQSGDAGYYFVQQVADMFPPELTLYGSPHVILEYGESFSEPGYSAVDDTDGDITDRVYVTGDVDEKSIGNYTLTYHTKDAAGNISTLDRTVEIRDTAPPVIVIDGNTPGTAEYGGYTEDGEFDGMSLLPLADIAENTLEVSAADPIDGIIPVTVTGSVNLFEVGNYTITYTAADKHGNEAIPAYSYVNVQDTISPDISLVGGNHIRTDYGEEFSDLGVLAADPVDGDLTASITMTNGTIDTSKIQEYTILYSVTDSNGNTANATRTVQVYENALSALESLPFNYTGINAKNDFDIMPGLIFLEVNLSEIILNGTGQTDLLQGLDVMELLDIEPYDIQKNNRTLSTITSHDKSSQYVMTPPVKSWVPNEEILLNVNYDILPEFGGVASVKVTPSGLIPVESDEWIMVQTRYSLPESFEKPQIAEKNITFEMLIDVTYPHSDGMANTTDWSNHATHEINPVIEIILPKPADGSTSDIDENGCTKLEPLYYDGITSQWVQGHARILSNVPHDEKFCTITMQTDHFSSFALVGTSGMASPEDNTLSSAGIISNGVTSKSSGRIGGGSSIGSPTSSEAIAILEDKGDESAVAIPGWVKSTAGLWGEGDADGKAFSAVLQYMADSELIYTNDTIPSEIPAWLKSTAVWWSEGKISDEEFTNSISYLVRTGVLS
jgi:hypothetical protein